MLFDFVGWLMNPYILMFVAVFTGLLFGKIKFGKFNFGVSGALFTGLVIGWLALGYAKGFTETDTGFKAAGSLISSGVVPKEFFTIFLILFVAAVGLLAAKDMAVVLKKYGVKFIILGVLITAVGAAATAGLTVISTNANPYEVSGVYTGALTSSPGLAAAIETAQAHSTEAVAGYDALSNVEKEKMLYRLDKTGALTAENTPSLSAEQQKQYITNAQAGIGVGHAIGYPFGVLIVIIAVNFFPKIFGINVEEEHKAFKAEMAEAKNGHGGKEVPEVSFDLIAFAIACFFGYTLGMVKIKLGFLGDFSLGSTGGVLIGSLILGYMGKIGPVNFRMNSKILGVVRQLSLAFFLGIVGLRYGFKVFDAILGDGWWLAVVALIVGLVAMMVGFIVGRYVFKINWIMLSGAICGGMTSTPGLGAAIDAVDSDDPAAGYGATYPFALLGMVIFTILLHKMPM
jgi:putative transport protein